MSGSGLILPPHVEAARAQAADEMRCPNCGSGRVMAADDVYTCTDCEAVWEPITADPHETAYIRLGMLRLALLEVANRLPFFEISDEELERIHKESLGKKAAAQTAWGACGLTLQAMIVDLLGDERFAIPEIPADETEASETDGNTDRVDNG